MNSVRLYLKMIAVSIRGQMQYRASFVMFTIGNLIASAVEILTVWAFFGRFGTLGGWTLPEVAVFYGIGNISFSIAEAFTREFDVFQNHVRTGEFDRVLLRPRSTVLQMLGAQCQIMRIGRFAQGVAVLAAGCAALNLAWNASHWALLVMAVIGGALLFAGMIVLQATSCFWTVESLEIWNCITYGGVTAVEYPLDIYQRPIRYLFTYAVPLAATSYWPCAYLLHRDYASPAFSFLAPLLGALFFFASLAVWRFGVRHYRSTGS